MAYLLRETPKPNDRRNVADFEFWNLNCVLNSDKICDFVESLGTNPIEWWQCMWILSLMALMDRCAHSPMWRDRKWMDKFVDSQLNRIQTSNGAPAAAGISYVRWEIIDNCSMYFATTLLNSALPSIIIFVYIYLGIQDYCLLL